jgi:hypothetical protein
VARDSSLKIEEAKLLNEEVYDNPQISTQELRLKAFALNARATSQ